MNHEIYIDSELGEEIPGKEPLEKGHHHHPDVGRGRCSL